MIFWECTLFEYVDRLYEQKLPIQVCDKKLFLSIIHFVLNGMYSAELANEQLKIAYKRAVDRL